MSGQGVVHIAGSVISIGEQLRQRCSWCGATLIDVDLSSVAVPAGSELVAYPTWEVGRLVEVDGPLSSIVDHEDGKPLPSNACGQLDHDITR